MTRWTYDEVPDEFSERIIPAAAIYLTEDQREIRTIDLMGAHVLIDVDLDGNLVSVEILGPAVFLDLKDLGRYLQEPDSTLRAVADDLTKLGEELEELAGDDGDQ